MTPQKFKQKGYQNLQVEFALNILMYHLFSSLGMDSDLVCDFQNLFSAVLGRVWNIS